jgi:hypothetical protein
MLHAKILPALLFVAPAFVVLTAQAARSEPVAPAAPAAQQCRVRPGPSTPRGTHWYYRLDHAVGRRCWYLGPEGEAVRAATPRAAAAEAPSANVPAAPAPANGAETMPAGAPAATQATTSEPTTSEATTSEATTSEATTSEAPTSEATTSAAPAPAAANPAPVEFLDGTIAAEKAQENAQTDFAARWPNGLPKPRDLTAAAPQTASDSYAEERVHKERSEPMPSLPVTAAMRTPPMLATDTALRWFIIGGSLAIAFLLFVGWAVKFMAAGLQRDRSRINDRWSAMMAGLYRRASYAAATDRKSSAPRRQVGLSLPPSPTDPAVDLKKSLGELMRDLRRTDAALDSGKKPRRPLGGKAYVLEAAE